MQTDLVHIRPARSLAAYLALGVAIALWFALGAIQAHWLVLAVFALPPTLLAWDILKNDSAELVLSDHSLAYGTGTQRTTIPLSQIVIVRLNRRLDFSWRVTLRLKDGQRARIPPPCLPPMPLFEAALRERDIKIDRVLFAFAG